MLQNEIDIHAKTILVIAMKASLKLRLSWGQADQLLTAPPDWPNETPVAMIVTPMASMIDTKSMYPKIATSANDGGRASISKMMADTIPNATIY